MSTLPFLEQDEDRLRKLLFAVPPFTYLESGERAGWLNTHGLALFADDLDLEGSRNQFFDRFYSRLLKQCVPYQEASTLALIVLLDWNLRDTTRIPLSDDTVQLFNDIIVRYDKLQQQRTLGQPADNQAPLGVETPLVLPNKPSIAVLPFTNISGDPEQEYFSDGMTEDLITALSSLAGELLVIGRSSVFYYKHKMIELAQVSRELRVRYIIEGSVRKANDRLRVTARLVDGRPGYQLWAEHYDRDLQDIFAVQEEIARRITASLAVRLTLMEQKYTNNVAAWEYFMRGEYLVRGAELYRQYTKEDNAQARELFEKAISLDPQFARAYANLAAACRQDWTYEWTADLRAAEQRAFDLAQRSVALDPSLPYGHQQLAYIHVYRLEHGDAIREAEQATQLGGPNYADGYAVLAQVLIYAGEPQKAIPLMEKAMDLDPKPVYYLYHLGQAYYVMGQYEKYQKGDDQKAMEYYQKAEGYLKIAMDKNRNHRPSRSYLIAVYVESGREAEARAILNEFPDMRRLIDLNQRRQVAPYQDPAIRDRLFAAWRRLQTFGFP